MNIRIGHWQKLPTTVVIRYAQVGEPRFKQTRLLSRPMSSASHSSPKPDFRQTKFFEHRMVRDNSSNLARSAFIF